MAKIKNNSAGAYIVEKTGYKKYIRYFVATLTVVIFVSGAALATYNHLNKIDKQSQVEEFSSELPGWWLDQYFGSSVCDKDICKADADPDTDKLTNAQEYFYHTNPLSAFTVKDVMNDGELVAAGFDPSRPGRMTFDEVLSDENIVGESLVFDQDIQKLIAESQDISKVNLTLVENDELNIIYEIGSEDVYLKYFAELRSKVNRHFSPAVAREAAQILQAGSGDVSNVQMKAKLLSQELKSISIPEPLLNFHKYNIAFYQLLSSVVQDPSAGDINIWYDNAQAFLAVQQKLNLERQLLNNKFGQ